MISNFRCENILYLVRIHGLHVRLLFPDVAWREGVPAASLIPTKCPHPSSRYSDAGSKFGSGCEGDRSPYRISVSDRRSERRGTAPGPRQRPLMVINSVDGV